MKQLLFVFLFLQISLFGLVSIHAQEWEQVGWQGGIISIKAQLGNTLIGQGYSTNLAGYSGISATPLTEIYRSTDEGKSWNIFRTGLPPCTWDVYIKTSGEYVYLFPDRFQNTIPAFDNFGVYVAKENDTEWTYISFAPILDGSPFSLLDPRSDPLMFFQNDTILAQFPGNNSISGSDGLYFSIDKGKSWELKSLPGVQFLGGIRTYLINHRVFALGWSSDDSTYSIVREFFFRSDNAGNTWKKLLFPDTNLTDPPLFINDSLLFYTRVWDNNGPIKGSSFRSLDGGVSWNKINLPYDSLSYDSQSIRFFFKLGNKLYIAEDIKNIHQAFTSNDDGTTWQHYPTLDTIYFSGSQIFTLGNRVFLGQDGTFFLSDTEITTPILYENSNGMKSNSGHVLLYVGGDTLFSSFPTEFTNVYYSDSLDISFDNGETWHRRLFSNNHYIPSKFGWVKNGTTLFAIGKEDGKNGSILLVSHNDGNSWYNEIRLPFPKDITQIFCSNDTVIVNASDGGNPSLISNLYISIDAGKSWITPSVPGLDNKASISLSYDDGKIDLYQNLLIFESSDLGATWEEKVPQGFINRYRYGPLFLEGNNQYLLASPLIDSESHTIFISSDGGENFQADPFINSDSTIIFPTYSEKGILFASAEISNEENKECILMCSFDSGWHWKQIGSILPDDPNIFVGADYIFMSGINELWRIPKSVLSTLKAPDQKNISWLSLTCFPNPSTISTHLSYSLPNHSNILIQAFDIMGRPLAHIASGAQDAGTYEVDWDTKALPAGSYIIRLTTGGESVSKVVEVVK